MKIIQAENLTKKYKRYKKQEGMIGSIKGLFHREYEEKTAVDAFDMTVDEGEFVGLIGPNGAGKTTLVKMLTGIIAPTEGAIQVLGDYPNKLEKAYKQQYAVVMGQIQTGELDLYLTKPVNPLLRITFEKVNPGSIPLLLFSACILLYGAKECGTSFSCINVAGYLLMVLMMTILYYDMEVLIRCFAFFVFSVNNLVKIEDTAIELCLKIPGVAFYGIYKIIFYCILPYGIIATLPTQMLIGVLSLKGILFGMIIVCIFTFLALSFWKYGVHKYESASC